MKVAELIGSRKEVVSIPETKSVLDAAKYLVLWIQLVN